MRQSKTFIISRSHLEGHRFLPEKPQTITWKTQTILNIKTDLL